MPSNFTEHYNLNQWEPEDQVRRADFNEDNAKIDGALKGAANALSAEVSARTSAVSALNAALARRGNCDIRFSSYTGDGSTTVNCTFPSVPALVLVLGLQSIAFFTKTSNVSIVQEPGGMTAYNLRVTWNGSQLSVNGNNESAVLNCSGLTYQVIAFCDMS